MSLSVEDKKGVLPKGQHTRGYVGQANNVCLFFFFFFFNQTKHAAYFLFVNN